MFLADIHVRLLSKLTYLCMPTLLHPSPVQGLASAPSAVDAFITAHSSAQYAQIAALERENAVLRGQLARFGGVLGLGAPSAAAVLAQQAESFVATRGGQLLPALDGVMGCSGVGAVRQWVCGSWRAAAWLGHTCCPEGFCSAAWPWLARVQM